MELETVTLDDTERVEETSPVGDMRDQDSVFDTVTFSDGVAAVVDGVID